MTRLPAVALRLALLAALSIPAAAPAGAPPGVDPAAIEAHVRFLADDLLEGRGIGTRGGALAAAYHEAVFRAAGLRPGGPDGYVQPVPMTAFLPDPEARVAFEHGGTRTILQTGEDFAVVNCGLPEGALRGRPLVTVTRSSFPISLGSTATVSGCVSRRWPSTKRPLSPARPMATSSLCWSSSRSATAGKR